MPISIIVIPLTSNLSENTIYVAVKKFFIKYWWIFPCVFPFLIIVLFISLSYATDYWVVMLVKELLILLALIVMSLSWIFLLISKMWRKALISFLALVLVVGILYFPLIWALWIMQDRYERHIPEEIEDVVPEFEEESPSSTVCDTSAIMDSLSINNYQ